MQSRSCHYFLREFFIKKLAIYYLKHVSSHGACLFDLSKPMSQNLGKLLSFLIRLSRDSPHNLDNL